MTVDDPNIPGTIQIGASKVLVPNATHTKNSSAILQQKMAPWLAIATGSKLPKCTNSQHLFALRWLTHQGTSPHKRSIALLAQARLLLAWGTPLLSSRLLDTEIDPKSAPIVHWYHLFWITFAQLRLRHPERALLNAERLVFEISTFNQDKSIDLHRQMGDLYLRFGFVQQAKRCWMAAAEIAVENNSEVLGEINRILANLSMLYDEHQSAEFLLLQSTQSSRSSARWLLTNAHLSGVRQNWNEAERLINEAERVSPTDPELTATRLVMRALVAGDREQWQRLAPLLTRAQERYYLTGDMIGVATCYRILGWLSIAQRREQDAWQNYKRALKLFLQQSYTLGVEQTLTEVMRLLTEESDRTRVNAWITSLAQWHSN